MVKLLSNHLKSGERAMVRKYAHFVLRRMVRPSILRDSLITIKVSSPEELRTSQDRRDMKDFAAWCTYDGIINEKKTFSVLLSANLINKRGRKPITKLKKVLIDLGHELTHVKQYLNNEIFDYVSGDVRYKGDVFEAIHDQDVESYYESPWEIEAYGREWGLFKMFKNKLKEEAKAKG